MSEQEPAEVTIQRRKDIEAARRVLIEPIAEQLDEITEILLNQSGHEMAELDSLSDDLTNLAEYYREVIVILRRLPRA